MRKPLIQRGAAVLFFIPMLLCAQNATVTFTTVKQKIDGFGGSSAWEGTFSDALMSAIYGNGANQLGLTILRNRIDPAGGWASDKSNSAKAKSLGAMVFATPWSPPESLKTNNNTVKGYIDSSKFAGFAAWMKSYVAYCGADNIDIMSIENEPDYAQQITYEGCGWSASNFMKFAKGYAPEIGKPIMLPESFNYSFSLSDVTLDDSAAAKNVSFIGGHAYGSQPKSYTKAINLGKHVWMTEWNATDFTAKGIMVLAKQILDYMYNDYNAYVYWWMTASGNGIISTTGTPNKYGWVLASFSKWVRPGYVRVDATYNPKSGVYVVAFKGAQNVTVAVNNSTASVSQTFAYAGATVTSVEKYTTSSDKNMTDDGPITATNNSFTATLDAQSISTFVSAGTGTRIAPKAERYLLANPLGGDRAGYLRYLINGRQSPLPVLSGREGQAFNMLVSPVQSDAGNGAGANAKPSK